MLTSLQDINTLLDFICQPQDNDPQDPSTIDLSDTDLPQNIIDLTHSPINSGLGQCLGIVAAEASRVKSDSNNLLIEENQPVEIVQDAGVLKVDAASQTIGIFPTVVSMWLIPLMQSRKIYVRGVITESIAQRDVINVQMSVYHVLSSGQINPNLLSPVEKDAWQRFTQYAGVTMKYIMDSTRPTLPNTIPSTSPTAMALNVNPAIYQNILSGLPSISRSTDDQEVIDLTSEARGLATATPIPLPSSACNTDVHLKQLFENLHTTTPLEEMEPSSILKVSLRPYQKQALAWLVKRERDEDAEHEDAQKSGEMPPDWREYSTVAGKKYYHNIVTKDTLWVRPTLPPKPKSTNTDPSASLRGGLLCDEMGLGKTVEVIAMLVTSKVRPQDPKPTLIVTPLSVLNQWADEIRSHTKEGALSVYLYHGSVRCRDPEFLSRHDVVLTTFTTLASELQDENGNTEEGAENSNTSASSTTAATPSKSNKRKRGKSNNSTDGATKPMATTSLQGVKWLRVVLDEAHTIKDRSTRAARAAFALESQRRWAVTGTHTHIYIIVYT